MGDRAPIRRYRTLVNSAGVVRWLARKMRDVERGKLDSDVFRSLAFGAQVLLRGISQAKEEEAEERITQLEAQLAELQERRAQEQQARFRLPPLPSPGEQERTAKLRAELDALVHVRAVQRSEPQESERAAEPNTGSRAAADLVAGERDRVKAELEAEARTPSTPDVRWIR